MIESCSRRRMLFGILALGALSILVIILESRHLHTTSDETADIHETHEVLKKKLSPGDKCWKSEPYDIEKECDLCTEDEIKNQSPVVCVAGKGYKELVKCKTSGKRTHRSCDRVVWVEESRFWKFEAFFIFSSVFCGAALFIRQKQLDHWMYQRIQRQMASGV